MADENGTQIRESDFVIARHTHTHTHTQTCVDFNQTIHRDCTWYDLYTHMYHHTYMYTYIFYINNWMADPRANYFFYTVSI